MRLCFTFFYTIKFLCRFNLSGKCNNGATKEELEEKRRAQVCIKIALILVLHSF